MTKYYGNIISYTRYLVGDTRSLIRWLIPWTTAIHRSRETIYKPSSTDVVQCPCQTEDRSNSSAARPLTTGLYHNVPCIRTALEYRTPHKVHIGRNMQSLVYIDVHRRTRRSMSGSIKFQTQDNVDFDGSTRQHSGESRHRCYIYCVHRRNQTPVYLGHPSFKCRR